MVVGPTDVSDLHRRITVANRVGEIVAPRSPFADVIDFPLASYLTPPTDLAADCRLTMEPANPRSRRTADSSRQWWLRVDGRRYRELVSTEAAVRWAEVLVLNRLIALLPTFAHIHGAIVARGERAVLLIGESGSGKSTTSTALTQVGYDLYTDDVALIDRSSLRPAVIPRPVKLDANARDLLASLRLTIGETDARGESVARHAVPGLPERDRLGPPIDLVVFLNQRTEHPSSRYLSAAEATIRLVQQSATERIASGDTSTFAQELIRHATSVEVTPGTLVATMRLIDQLVATLN